VRVKKSSSTGILIINFPHISDHVARRYTGTEVNIISGERGAAAANVEFEQGVVD
jgi:hypothetical protein